MMKRFISILSLICLSLAAFAESQYMIVEMKNGTSVSFLLADKPVVTFQNSYLEINKDAQTTYAIENVNKFYFKEGESTNNEITPVESLRVISVDENTLEVQNAQPNLTVSLLSIMGVTISQVNVNEEGSALINMPDRAGVYLLLVGNQSVKIIRK